MLILIQIFEDIFFFKLYHRFWVDSVHAYALDKKNCQLNNNYKADTNDASERRSVMAGGGVRGWLPDVAVVLWRRMLSALGDVNNIQDPVLHGQVMDYLVQLTQTLVKIRMNQGVSGDNQATPPAPDLIPPLTVIAPWCFKVRNNCDLNYL